MEWTGARYADKPTVEVETRIDASPEQVWDFITDVSLMPELSTELQSVEWQDDATGPSVGARFLGRSKHDALGEWATTSHVIEYEPYKRFAWAVENPADPTAIWRYTVEPDGDGTLLKEWMQLGPGRSGLSFAIDRMPDKEEKIVFVRMREFEGNMAATLDAIKKRVEAA